VQVLGSVDETTLQREYAEAALLLMPSRYEGLGRTALEAQAAGTPVVGYDVTGLRDAVREGGVLVGAGDVAALTGACEALLGDDRRRSSLGEQGREFVKSRHSPGVVLDQLERNYEAVVTARKPAPV